MAFTWHPGQEPTKASEVEVRFEGLGPEETLVTLEHRGWQVFADPDAARREYDQGWPLVLDRYRQSVAGEEPTEAVPADLGDSREGPDQGGDTWVALLHRPGAQAPTEGTIFTDPRFADHVAFLGRMQEAGYLVAAGPFPRAPSEGMTVLRLPGPRRLEDAVHLATSDDASVASGFLAVEVRPWAVMLAGL